MLLAIDVGNSHTVFGVRNGKAWTGVWRHKTDPEITEDELYGWLLQMASASKIDLKPTKCICASVVPSANASVRRLCKERLGSNFQQLSGAEPAGLKIEYEPPSAVGADRIANALGAIDRCGIPVVIVDFGTGTTVDVVDGDGVYLGGAIMPGVIIGAESLYKRAAKLPQVEEIAFSAPHHAIGRNTVEALQSGVVFGYADAVDGLVGRVSRELRSVVKVIATGGLGEVFASICTRIDDFEPMLTLDGLAIAADRLIP